MRFQVRYKAKTDPTGAGLVSVICQDVKQARERFNEWAKDNGLKGLHSIEISRA